jgi:hypothetical protein
MAEHGKAIAIHGRRGKALKLLRILSSFVETTEDKIGIRAADFI